ncbi:hypothetical protein CPter291_2677 [Collimonas pratensis]|uniref:Uncharacterized protein n=1 Tax=Collimonas pratensis TaxID=279113 RepID=A0ABN4MCK2_9BURK|nr:hypothetical protein CPter291_2677 [Collimonas pratensis]
MSQHSPAQQAAILGADQAIQDFLLDQRRAAPSFWEPSACVQ